MAENLDYKKASEEALNLVEESFIDGAQAMLHYLQANATECFGRDNCLICQTGKKFFKLKHRDSLRLSSGGTKEC